MQYNGFFRVEVNLLLFLTGSRDGCILLLSHIIKMQRKKRRSKYDISRLYEGTNSKPFFINQPGQSSFYEPKLEQADTNGRSLQTCKN